MLASTKRVVHSIVWTMLLVSLVAVAVFIPLRARDNTVAEGATSNMVVSMHNNSQMPFDCDWCIGVKNSSGDIVYSHSFNGKMTSNASISLVVGEHYSFMVYAPTGISVNMQMTLGSTDVYLTSQYFGDDFVMPSGGVNVVLLFSMENASIFFGGVSI